MRFVLVVRIVGRFHKRAICVPLRRFWFNLFILRPPDEQEGTKAFRCKEQAILCGGNAHAFSGFILFVFVMLERESVVRTVGVVHPFRIRQENLHYFFRLDNIPLRIRHVQQYILCAYIRLPGSFFLHRYFIEDLCILH